MRSFFDTNVLLYLFDLDEPEKRARAQEIFAREAEADRVVVSTQVLQEFYVNATRKLGRPLPPEIAEERVGDFSKLTLVQADAPLISGAIARSRRMSFSFWDALIVEAALKSGADRRFTEDMQHGRIIEGMRVENPFL